MPTRLTRLALLLVLMASSRVTAQAPPALFVSADSAQSIAALDAVSSPAVADWQAVGMRLDSLFGPDAAEPRVLLNVDGRDWVARLHRVDGDALGFRSWVGAIEGVAHSHVVFTERDGTVSGLINAVAQTYRVRTVAPGSYLLERMSADRSRGDSEPRTGTLAERQAAADAVEAAGDTASTIDVLMLYTPNARGRAGGVAQIQATASQIISDSNTIFSRSSVVPRMRLVGTVEFAMAEALTMWTDLNAVTDSVIARGLRDTYRADLVQLLVSSPDMTVCGLGWLLTSLSSTTFDAYSVVDTDCVPQYSPTHEMGHNMGSHHAPEDGASGALLPYSYGYKDPVRGFRTVMASSCSTGSCPRIANFSNPGILHNGVRTGSDTQNNSLSINHAALTVANWRQSAATGGGTGGTGGTGTTGGTGSAPPLAPQSLRAELSAGRVTLTWSMSAATPAFNGFVIDVGTAPLLGNLGSFDTGSTALRYITPHPLTGVYFVRVRARNLFGASPPSNEVIVQVVGIPSSVCLGPPPAPVALSHTVAGSLVSLSWFHPLTTWPMMGYRLDVGSGPGLANLLQLSLGTGTAFSGLAPPGVYYARIRAVNACGIGGPSNEVSVIVQ